MRKTCSFDFHTLINSTLPLYTPKGARQANSRLQEGKIARFQHEKTHRTLADGFLLYTKYKIRTYDPIRVKDVLYH